MNFRFALFLWLTTTTTPLTCYGAASFVVHHHFANKKNAVVSRASCCTQTRPFLPSVCQLAAADGDNDDDAAAAAAASSSKNAVIVTRLADSAVEIEIPVPGTATKAAYDKVCNELSKNIQIPGFRKGSRIPPQVLEQTMAAKSGGSGRNAIKHCNQLDKQRSKFQPKNWLIATNLVKNCVYPSNVMYGQKLNGKVAIMKKRRPMLD
jgi:Bacterial trigger factor protein (TF)